MGLEDKMWSYPFINNLALNDCFIMGLSPHPHICFLKEVGNSQHESVTLTRRKEARGREQETQGGEGER